VLIDAIRMCDICSSEIAFLRSLCTNPALLNKRSTDADDACDARNWRAILETFGKDFACAAHHSKTLSLALARIGMAMYLAHSSSTETKKGDVNVQHFITAGTVRLTD
jgi:hypothetical protein